METRKILSKIWFWWIVLMSLMVLFGCTAKKKLTEKTKTETQTKISSNENVQYNEHSEQKILEEKKKETIQQTQQASAVINITGEAETDQPFTFTTTENGRPQKIITVTGKAKISIQNAETNSAATQSAAVSTSREDQQRTIIDYLKKADSAGTTKTAAKAVTNEKKTVGFQTGFWIVLAFALLISIITFGAFKYFKK